ncbi:MAG: PAS domain S-box protein [Phycisphaerales bacterium]
MKQPPEPLFDDANEEFAQAIVETLHEPLLVLSPDLVVKSANRAFYQHFEVEPAETIGRKIYDLGNGQWNIPSLRTLLEDVLPDNTVFNNFEVEHHFESIGRRFMLVNARRLDHAQLILLGIRDETDADGARQALRTSRQRLAGLYANAKVGISEITADGRFINANDEMCRIMGRSRDELLACTIKDVTHPDDVERCLDEVERLLETGQTVAIEKRYRRPDGSSVYVSSTASLLKDGDPTTIVVVTIDLTERRHTETALRSSEARLHALVTATSDVVFRMSPDWTRMRRLHVDGYLEDATSDQPWLERYIPHHAQEAVLEAVARAKERGEVFELEHQFLRQDGSIGWMHSKAVPVADDDGRIVEWFGAATDITDRKQAEEAIQRSEARMRLLTDALPVLISYVDVDRRFGFVNQTYVRWFGRPREQISGRPVEEVLGRDAYEQIRPRLELAMSGRQVSFETTLVYPNAGRRDVSAVYVPDVDESGEVRGMFAMISDMTDRRRAEAALEASEAQYRALFESIDEGFCVIDLIYDDAGTAIDYAFTEINPAFERHTGLTDAVGKRIMDLVPDLEPHWVERYARVAATGEAERFVERSEAMNRWFDVYAFCMGKPPEHRVAILFNDITERTRAEEALRISEQRYRLLVESAREYAMLMIDPDGTIASWNAGAERLFGYTAQEMIGAPSETLYTEEDRAAGAPERKRTRALAEGQVATDQWYRRKDGSRFWANGVLRPLENGYPRGFIKILRDQTRQKAHEEQLRTVMAELNHRVKNTLAVVQSIASQTMRRAPDLASFRRDFERRLSSIAKAHNLLTRTTWTGVTLGRVIDSELDLTGGAAARLHTSGPDITLPPHMALAVHMVLHELATNAHKYGCLATASGSLDIRWQRLGTADEPELELSWTERCPDPVEAPKAEGFGSRLIEQLVVYELGGTLERRFESCGLAFSLRVPLTRAPTQADAPDHADGHGENGRATPDTDAISDQAARSDTNPDQPTRPAVLLVEDLAPLAMAMKAELEHRGFAIIGPASSVAQARALAERTLPAAAILDVNLGDEQVYPLIPVLEAAGVPMVLLTGHEPGSLPEAVHHVPVLPKPVELDDLERFLRAHAPEA